MDQLRYDRRAHAQAHLDIVDWIEEFYNPVRMQPIGYRTPMSANSDLIARLVYVESGQ